MWKALPLFLKHGENVTDRTTAQWKYEKRSKQFDSQKKRKIDVA